MRTDTARRWLAMLVLAGAAFAAPAQSLESVLRPGDVIQGHAKLEDDCAQCHVRFDRHAQDRLCTACHQDVGRDLAARTGWHGRQPPQACRSCHTDHKGRQARIVVLDEKRFDHTQTDFALKGRHEKVECRSCHLPPRRWREAPSDCHACHQQDDNGAKGHRGALGRQCGNCHGEQGWKPARFDHDRTRFALAGAHAEARCGACHAEGRYKDTPRACIGCHRADDDGAKGHRGRFGPKCDSCHGPRGWKPSTFQHDQDTKFPLRFSHRQAKCADCHTGTLFKDKTGSACVDCHQRDDDGPKGHRGSLGRDCGACHQEKAWKDTGGRFDHARTRFPLRDAHRDLACRACHKTPDMKAVPRDCVGCHRQDDRHAGTLGSACADCHGERRWADTAGRFDHARTRFPLQNAHAVPRLRCDACHRSAQQMRDTPRDCVACHRRDDRHAGQLGSACAQCHGDRSWKVERFDHRATRWPLLGRHAAVPCGSCHKTARYRETPRDCVACHQADDRHERRFGSACERCHNARGWGLWAFDHAAQARFPLDGAHRATRCSACHLKPAPAGQAAAPLAASCGACHRADDPHDGGFGPACDQCHHTDRWQRLRPQPGVRR
jgi:hypothetical protein